jgi:DNA-binding CsgD family transcriptional regulator
MPGASGAGWSAAFSAATTLSSPEDWRRDLAREVREAAGAEFVSIMTCPPADWGHFQQSTHPYDYAPLLARIDREFKPRIEQVGEGWRFAVAKHGTVYTPLDVAVARPLADEMREVLMRPAGIDGYVVAYFLDRAGNLVAMAAVGARCGRGELLDRVFDPLERLSRLAGSTLGGALELAGACRALSAAPAAPGLGPLSSREQEVARLVTLGLSNLNIGARLGIAEATVAVHLKRIYGKLGVRSRVQLAMRCAEGR